MNDRLNVGKRIKQIRSRLKLTQEQFGEQLGVKKLAIARYEAGRVPRIEMLSKIALLGRVNVAWLFGSDSPRAPHAELIVPEAVQNLTERLVGELCAAGSPIWSSRQFRTRYEERSKELLSRSLRDLIEYRHLLETERKQIRRARRPRS